MSLLCFACGAAMKLICAIVVFGLSMLSDVIVLGVVTGVLFTLAVLLALPVLDELSEMMEGRTLAS